MTDFQFYRCGDSKDVFYNAGQRPYYLLARCRGARVGQSPPRMTNLHFSGGLEIISVIL